MKAEGILSPHHEPRPSLASSLCRSPFEKIKKFRLNSEDLIGRNSGLFPHCSLLPTVSLAQEDAKTWTTHFSRDQFSTRPTSIHPVTGSWTIPASQPRKLSNGDGVHNKLRRQP